MVIVYLSETWPKMLTFNCRATSYLLNQEKLENEIGPRLIHMVNSIAMNLNNM